MIPGLYREKSLSFHLVWNPSCTVRNLKKDSGQARMTKISAPYSKVMRVQKRKHIRYYDNDQTDYYHFGIEIASVETTLQ